MNQKSQDKSENNLQLSSPGGRLLHAVEEAIKLGRSRNKHEITQKTGVSKAFFSDLAAGRSTNPSADNVRKICEELQINQNYILSATPPVLLFGDLSTHRSSAEGLSDLPRSIMQTVAALEELLGDQSPEVRSDPVLRRLSQELAGHLLEKIQLLRSSGGPGSEQT